jgi:hypothetical protein
VPASDNDNYVIVSTKVMTHHLNTWRLGRLANTIHPSALHIFFRDACTSLVVHFFTKCDCNRTLSFAHMRLKIAPLCIQPEFFFEQQITWLPPWSPAVITVTDNSTKADAIEIAPCIFTQV